MATPGKRESKRRRQEVCYGHFHILKNIGDNASQLKLPSYMKTYSIINVKNLKPFKPSMLDNELGEVMLLMEDLHTYNETSLLKDNITKRKLIETHRGTRKAFCIGKNGQKRSALKWFTREREESMFPNLKF